MRLLTLTGALLLAPALFSQVYTRGIGIYPGDPREDFSPQAHIDNERYRNLALHRAVYQSSSYDYNLTGQLITDGTIEQNEPQWIAVSTSEQGTLPRSDRESVLDDNWASGVTLRGTDVYVQFEIGGAVPAMDRLDFDALLVSPGKEPEEWSGRVLTSRNGQQWTEIGQTYGRTLPAGEVRTSVALTSFPQRFLRLQLLCARAGPWTVSEVRFFNKNAQVRIAGPFHFSSAWMSAGSGQEWVYVDLGAICSLDEVKLYWIQPPAAGSVQVSGDAQSWRDIATLPSSGVKLKMEAHARYVRVLMMAAVSGQRYVLSELEVYGKGGPVFTPRPQASPTTLSGGAWRLARTSEVQADGVALSSPGYDDSHWIPATIPGTTLTSYFNIGAVADPNFGDHIFSISDSYFYSDFWYRDEFTAPQLRDRTFLNLHGLNWKAEVYLNGHSLGLVTGGFIRGRFDVTPYIHPGKNALALRVIKNVTPGNVREKTWDSPGKNGGALGADNPTYHASIGWDWIPTVRGRNTGIWADVTLETTGPVTVENPFVHSKLADGAAEVAVETTVVNHSNHLVNGHLRGRMDEFTFDQPVSIEANASEQVQIPAIHVSKPRLWWPNGYGAPNLYNVELHFETEAGISGNQVFQTGIREFTYKVQNGALLMFINGRRFIPRGGNWGFPEVMLRYRAREYDTAMAYHQDQHFNMVRDWVGQVGDDAFYEAADRHGIVVQQDFWLANPWDGPDPNDDSMFLKNAQDLILRIRNHPSIGLYCGRNEGFPPQPLQAGFEDLLAKYHPGIHYIPSSADETVSGHGPYQAMPVDYYFTHRATEKLHSELGMPNIMTLDSLRLTMPESAFWPLGREWGLHDFSLHGAQGGASFIERINESFGGARNAAEFTQLAQFVNYDGYRAMFEAQSKYRMGLLIWMSHPAWPSFVWDTYDYFFNPTAAYFGAKKACEPLHVQWNPITGEVEVVNYSAGDMDGLTVRARVVNTDGSVKFDKTVSLESKEDSTQEAVKLNFPDGLTPIHFIALELRQGDRVLSTNTYMRSATEYDYQAIRKLPEVNIKARTVAADPINHPIDETTLRTTLENTSNSVGLLVQVKAVRSKTGDQILPAIYSDNFLTLLPGEKREITTVLKDADMRGEKPAIQVTGLNVQVP